MNTLFRFGVGLLMLMVGCGTSFGVPKEPPKVYLVDGGDHVIEMPWTPKLSLLDAVARTGGYFRLHVHIWRHNDRKRMKLKPKDEKAIRETRFQPDDVIIFGYVTEERAKKLEKMEVISRVLKLDSHSPPPEIDKPVQF